MFKNEISIFYRNKKNIYITCHMYNLYVYLEKKHDIWSKPVDIMVV